MTSRGTKLELRAVSHAFSGTHREEVAALDAVTIAIPERRFISILGPSGCGKSTIFNLIAGLLVPSQGDIYLDGMKITGMIGFTGYMLQKDMLLPWRTVLDNVILGMELRGVPKREARERAAPHLRRYGLAGFESHYPAALSGGMRQRAALLRTLLYDSDVVLLDEPFGALDAQTRAQMQEWLLQLWADFQKTVVFVTHDVEEAVYLSDQVIVMTPRPGRIKDTLDVPISRPRAPETLHHPDFIALKQRCLELLRHVDGRDMAGGEAA
ncbi:MAG TPA: ABC transporter ATP-binding protein [Stellaceae bacterium]|jgi:ABC-type nitrate/sulfonate/bicarbonate transport system ATPase subunit